MAAAMVSEGDSRSQSWSGALRGIPGPSSGPCLARATSGIPSSGFRDVSDWACFSQIPPPRPRPRIRLVKARSFGGGTQSEERSRLPSPPVPIPALVSSSCDPLFLIFTCQPRSLRRAALLFPPLLLLLTSRLCAHRGPPPLVLTSPRTRPHL